MTPTTTRPRSCPDEHASDSQSPETQPLSEDEIFHILQTNRRRAVISYLLDRDGPIKMGDITEYVTARENETTVENISSTQRQRVYIPLYQSHLPKLEEKGLIEYHKPRGIVRPTEKLETFRPYLETTDEATQANRDTRCSRIRRLVRDYHVTAICASTSLLVAVVVGIVQISGLVLAATVLTLFFLATLATNVIDSVSSNDAIETRLTQ